MRPFSEDLRKRIIEAKQGGKSSAEVAKRFAVSGRTVERYWERYEREGHCQAKQIGGYRRASLADHQKTVTAWIQKQPDLTLEELVARCQKELQVKLSVSGLWHRLKAFGLSYKKNAARRRAGSP